MNILAYFYKIILAVVTPLRGCGMMVICLLLSAGLASCENGTLPEGDDPQEEEWLPLSFCVGASLDIAVGNSRAVGVPEDVLQAGQTVGVFVVSGQEYEKIMAGDLSGLEEPANGFNRNKKYVCETGGQTMSLVPADDSDLTQKVYYSPNVKFAVFAYSPYDANLTLRQLLSGEGTDAATLTYNPATLKEDGTGGYDQSTDIQNNDYLFAVPGEAGSTDASSQNPLVKKSADASVPVTLNFRHQRAMVVLHISKDWMVNNLGDASTFKASDISISVKNVAVSCMSYTLSSSFTDFEYTSSQMTLFPSAESTSDGVLMAKGLSYDSEVAGGEDGLTVSAVVFPYEYTSAQYFPKFVVKYTPEGGNSSETVLSVKNKSTLTLERGQKYNFTTSPSTSSASIVETRNW